MEFQPDLRDAFPEMRAKGIRITIRGTEGFPDCFGLGGRSSDPVVIKKRYSAFYGTTLDGILTGLNPDGLILAGINTHACIRMAAIDAYQRDWEVILAADCVDPMTANITKFRCDIGNGKIASVMSNEEIRRMLAPTD
jgi:bifunctional isochorismate lyase/aryl carrier protein